MDIGRAWTSEKVLIFLGKVDYGFVGLLSGVEYI